MNEYGSTVDIIIPIYNAYDDLKKCVTSVRKYTDLQRHRLILLNDNSSDERIKPYIDSISDGTHILAFTNEKNLGFSGNINKGIAQSDKHDVLLLNSDTIVTRGWIDKIIACAYSDVAIGTVTPLSNNATICSVPEFCKENPVPVSPCVDEMGELIERISLKRYPQIPVAHGFCMFIKRNVIELVGLFDAETFGRGYGEENDFCFRAEQMGFIHVMCDDTYICHTGTSSFQSEEKRKYIEEHEKILIERYPKQFRRVQEYCRDNPNRMIQDNVKYHLAACNGKYNILFVVQADFRQDAADHVGGTQLHVKDLTDGLKYKYNIFVLARNQEYINLTEYIDDEIFSFRFFAGEKPIYQQIHNEKMREIYAAVVDGFHIDLIHVHHVLGLSHEIYYVARERGIPIINTLHDYYMICPTIKLLNLEEKVCWDEKNVGICAACLEKQMKIAEGLSYIDFWRKENRKVLGWCTSIIVPSNSAKTIISSYYPELKENIQVIEHGLDINGVENNTPEKKKGEVFRVAFIGGLNVAKGSEYAYQMIKNGDKKIQWYVFGKVGDDHLRTLEQKNLTKYGAYERDELPELLKNNQIDLVCILPIWPETFCYTLSEALLCKIPVLVTDMGALGERIKKMQVGWRIPYEAGCEAALEVIDQIKDRGEPYRKTCETLLSVRMRTVHNMVVDYEELYNKEIRADVKRLVPDSEKIARAYLMANGYGFEGGDSSWIQRLVKAEKELEEIRTSVTYRIVQKLGEVKIPFRKQLKKVLIRVYRGIK